MAGSVEVGMRLHAKWSDGEFYAAEVVAKRKGAKPVKVSFTGFDEVAWKSLDDLKSKKLKSAKAEPAAPAKSYDYSGIEKGMRVQAESGGTYYAAEVVAVKSKSKAPVKVKFVGYDGYDEWVGGDRLRSKALKEKEAAEPKAKAKAKAKPAKVFDYSGLEKGMRVQAEADGKYYAAEVVTVSTNKAKSKAPVKVHFVGYTAASDEWVGGERLRAKALQVVKAGDAAGKTPGGMPQAAKKYLLVKPKMLPPLDKGFRPMILGKRKYLEAAKDCTDKLDWALVRSDGVARYTLPVFPEKSRDVAASIYLAGVLIQEMIWQRSASSMMLCGPARVCKALEKMFAKGGSYEFEALSMPNVCGHPEKPFEVKTVEKVEDLPAAKDTPQVCGKDASGCRLAFDLGKSDIKTVAVKDNEVVYSKETEWDVTNVDPQYHFDAILDALKKAKETLPKVDAVGGSATGTISEQNEATWCDIFPNVPPAVYKEKVVDIFCRLSKEIAGDVPLKVINDGEVTALAAYQKIKAGNIMGISMGSSEGGGYCNKDGNLMGWINEMCYIRLDLNPKAPTDPWTKGAHTGISHMYLGQRGATKLAPSGGVELEATLKYPHKEMCTIKHENHAQVLKKIQEAMKDPEKEAKVKEIYETVGVYLGYALGQYCEFYEIDHVMILGRVSKGAGGDLMLDTAKKVLAEEFPDCSKITFHTADDHFKAVGQCIAAAALPTIK
jgi:predicted NBD/HSP70 family sugar kinase